MDFQGIRIHIVHTIDSFNPQKTAFVGTLPRFPRKTESISCFPKYLITTVIHHGIAAVIPRTIFEVLWYSELDCNPSRFFRLDQ